MSNLLVVTDFLFDLVFNWLYKIQLAVFLFLVSHQFLYQQISFLSQVFLFNGFTQIPHSFNCQNLLSGTNIFVNFSLKCLLNIFFKYLLTKSCKSIFYVSVVNCYCTYIVNGSKYRFTGVLIRTYFKNSYFNTSIRNYLWIEFIWIGFTCLAFTISFFKD